MNKFEKKIKEWIKAGLETYRIFIDDLEFEEFTNSGMMKHLLNNYFHTTTAGGTCFVFYLKCKQIAE